MVGTIADGTTDRWTPARARRLRSARRSIIREILSWDGVSVLSLAGGMPNPDTIPVEALGVAAASVLHRDGGAALQYGRTDGATQLRELLAEEEARRCGRAVHPDQIIVTSGSQQALDLLGRCLVDPGDGIAIEQPGYLGAIQAFGAYEPRWVGVPSDEHGIDVEVLEERLAGVKVVYVGVDFSNPSGSVLALERRRALAELAERHDVLVVEDDPYGAIRFDGSDPLPPVAAFTDRVVSLRTASKTVAPGLRIGWTVGPADVIADLTLAKQAVDLHTATLTQAMLAELLAEPGFFERRSAELSAFYAERAATLHLALTAIDGVSADPARGGLFLWARAPVDTSALLDAAVAEGVAFVPGSVFDPDGAPSRMLRASFATLDDAGLREAAARVERAVHAAQR